MNIRNKKRLDNTNKINDTKLNQENHTIIDKIKNKMERKLKRRAEKPIEYDKIEIIDIKNLKNQFKRSVKNYMLNDNNELLYKTKIKYI